jgi:hypothetical protein
MRLRTMERARHAGCSGSPAKRAKRHVPADRCLARSGQVRIGSFGTGWRRSPLARVIVEVPRLPAPGREPTMEDIMKRITVTILHNARTS